jgi:AcrR family transcriptional regulator
MAAVGQRSGSSPGTVYQFFANKEALVTALAEQSAAAVERAFDDAIAAWIASSLLSADAFIDALFSPMLKIYRNEPAWLELLHALSRRGEPGAIESRLDQNLIERLGTALAALSPQATERSRELAAAMLLEVGHAGLGLVSASRQPEAMDVELRRCLKAYLSAWQASVGDNR